MMMTATPTMPAPHSLRTFATADFHLTTVPGLLSMADMDDSCCAFADGGQDWTYGAIATTKTDKKKKKMDEVRPMGCNIRFSALQLDYEDCQNELPDPMFNVTTATFKNSIWNRAHYGNPDFHPEEWNPSDDGGGPHARFGSRRRPRPSLM
ncbi:hypothetical protein VHEMI06186 [[Torrubiella] hemipterigena]|uniref:Uncharacterized protein n=1 Tax=[Torrubiella] hemipterigena TaxID=1531966 RepID=A0A0A1TKH7_9HYPO|nr:hypothetical protein VHEMI06186 [[Torrubiella] hemipterigena]